MWTPPHFWALALYRLDDYRKSGLPMLPVTHGERLTRLHILLYTVVLVATTALPFVIQMSGWIYLVSALALGAIFLWYAWRLFRALQRPPRAQHLQLLDRLSRRAVRGTAGRSLRDAADGAANAMPARLLLVVFAALLVGCEPDAARFNNVDITGANYARDFRLTDFNGQPRSLADFRGKVVVMFFGYHAVPGRLPDDDDRHGGSEEAARTRRRQGCR